MPQQVLTDGGMASAPKAHFDQHKSVYRYIENRLSDTKDVFIMSDKRGELLRHSVEYAIISVQTNVDRHEPAFVESRGVTGQDNLADVLADNTVLYHNNKARYIHENRQNVDYSELADRLVSGDIDGVHSDIMDSCLGLGAAKSAFSLAMLGFTSKICVDSRTANACGMDRYASSDTSMDEYNELCETVLGTFPEVSNELTPFGTQWVLFSTDRDKIETHDPFYAWISEVTGEHLL